MSQFLKTLHDCSFESNHRREVSLLPSESLPKSHFPKTTGLLTLYSVQATEEVSLFLVWVPSSVPAKSLYIHTPQHLPVQRNPD